MYTQGESEEAHPFRTETYIVSAHRQILGMASVVCVLVKICVSSISLYKLDPDKLTTPFESAHQFTLVCTVSDFKTVLGCTTIHAQNHSFVLTSLTPTSRCSERFSHSLDTLCPCCTLICAYCDRGQGHFFVCFASASKVQLSR